MKGMIVVFVKHKLSQHFDQKLSKIPFEPRRFEKSKKQNDKDNPPEVNEQRPKGWENIHLLLILLNVYK